jgi:hypothetical protein
MWSVIERERCAGKHLTRSADRSHVTGRSAYIRNPVERAQWIVAMRAVSTMRTTLGTRRLHKRKPATWAGSLRLNKFG